MPKDPRLARRNVNPDTDSCETCQYNFDDICVGYGERTDNEELTFGMPMDLAKEMFPDGCECYSISSTAYNKEREKSDDR